MIAAKLPGLTLMGQLGLPVNYFLSDWPNLRYIRDRRQHDHGLPLGEG